MDEWHDLFVAAAGASAALAGLIFVGISINLEGILRFPHLVNRAAAALVLLLNVLALSIILLAPGQSDRMIGIEMLLVGLLTWGLTTQLAISGARKADRAFMKHSLANIGTLQIATIPTIIAGVVVFSRGSDALYWLLPCFILSFAAALGDAWVLLVEINR